MTAINRFWADWNNLRTGQAFRVPGSPHTGLYIKMSEDPFGAPIGSSGYVNVMTGYEGHITELFLMTIPLHEQIELVNIGVIA